MDNGSGARFVLDWRNASYSFPRAVVQIVISTLFSGSLPVIPGSDCKTFAVPFTCY